jgi:hypothetical protein
MDAIGMNAEAIPFHTLSKQTDEILVAAGSLWTGSMPEQALRLTPFGGQTRAPRLED